MPHALALLLAIGSTATQTLTVEVYVPLCDSALIACGRGSAGDPRSLSGNLYWGAAYGAERFLSKAKGFRVLSRTDDPDPRRAALLREMELARDPAPGEREVRFRLRAYAGDHIDDALADFLAAAGGKSDSDLVVWAGHDRLMDVPPPAISRGGNPRPVAVLACSSERFFGPPLRAAGARPVALTRTFMAPEAYLLEALGGAIARHGVGNTSAIREALVSAYARYQRLSLKAAGSVFSVLPSLAPERGAD